MFIPFDKLAETSRLWVYSSSTEITKEQAQIISQELTCFLDAWEYHKKKLSASFKIFENRFIIVALDDSEHGVGGCSMDGLQRLIQTLEQQLSLSLMNRLNVFCKIDGEIECIPSFNFKDSVDSDTLFYDLTIQKKSEINSYLKPVKNGWCRTLL